MIVWINGFFGVGKSTTAMALASRLDCPLVDPEEIGVGLPEHRLNGGPAADFQDLPLWRTLTVETVRTVADEYGSVVVPMTLLNPNYFDKVVGALVDDGHEVQHFTLVASMETVLQRGLARKGGVGPWAKAMNLTYAHALSDPRFAEVIDTELLPFGAVVDLLSKRFGQ